MARPRINLPCLAGLLTVVIWALVACGGSSAPSIQPDIVDPVQLVRSDSISLSVLKNASGAPAGVRVSWPRIDDAEVSGYYIYRDTESLPDGDPTGYDEFRVNSGDKVDQFGTGTDTLTFDDLFSPAVGETFFYRMTVVNQTDDESDFSDELSITIAEHTVVSVSQAGGSIGDEVTITGTFFGDTRDGDEVFFTNASGQTNVPVESGGYVSWSATEIVVEIPYGAADGVVGVSIDDATVLSDDEVDYNEPQLDSVSPGEDWVQNGFITLTGQDFGPAPSTVSNATKLFFGSTEADPADFDEGQWSDTQIVVKVPADAVGGTVDVKVSVAGNESGTQPFLLLPHLDSLNTNSGSVGSSVTLTGTNFGVSQGSGLVSVNNAGASVLSWSNTSVTITIPAGALDGNVVLVRDDTEATNGIGFDVIPTISSLSPSRRNIGEELTITGTGFGNNRNGSEVIFDIGDIAVVSYVSWANNQVKVLVPAGAKTGIVRVEIADNSVGSNQDTAESSGTVAVLLPPPVIEDTEQL